MHQPEYFKRTRSDAAKLWDQLERQPELAGSWRQLFIQVQSPRHVLSELLQNADDAGATEAAVEIDDGEFIFSHNGEDFSEEQFASLCRFGFSNKRTLHTIGFRGVGFKSTFSLGGEVRLVTPTLSVAFHQRRFTEPIWMESPGTLDGRTEIRVDIQSELVQQELGKNLREWGDSPASLLFFNNIRCLRLQDQDIRWESEGAGPIEGSEWMAVSNTPAKKHLIIRSSEEAFPEDALNEIKNERMTPDDDTTFPPCRVEIVLGMEGRLFVVLPTGVLTQLPFACNAPFIQDPARMKIKDPVLSPTNGWLLKRAGELAADAMLAWVGKKALDVDERGQAYGLLPDVERKDNSIEGSCGALVKKSFGARIACERFLITETDDLEPSGNCLGVPHELLGVWSPEQVTAGFSEDGLAILSQHVGQRDRTKLVNCGHIKTLVKSQVLETLKNNHLPRPRDWQQLLRLWEYVADGLISLRSSDRDVRIVPVIGKNVLYAAHEVVHLGERRNLKLEDSEFLSPHFLAMDSNWTRFLADQRQAGETSGDGALKMQVQLAQNVITALGLGESTNVDRLISRIADTFFTQNPPPEIEDVARLTHIAAKLGAAVPEHFRFVTQAGELKSGPILVDIDNDLDLFVDADWYKKNVLHDAYANTLETCTADEWRQWVRSVGSRLHTFVPLVQTRVRMTGRERLRGTLRQRGFEGEPYFHYKYDNFWIEDWDFDSTHWNRWNSLARNDDRFWSALLTRILEQPRLYWSGAISARAVQEATTGNTRAVTQEPLTPKWIIRLRELPCLTDTWGRPRQPAEIFRRTPETEPLRDVESFVNAELDTEAARPLLILLGVRDKPTGPERLLERLQALAGSRPPLLPEVQKWCHSLDRLFDRCSTEEINAIKTAFGDNRMILTEQDNWASTEEVFLSTDEDGVPGTVLIHPSLRMLALWRKIGVPERPSADQAIDWLKGLPSGKSLTPSDARRARALMSGYPRRMWDECGHWLNLQGQWVPIDRLAYSLTMQSLVPWSHLFPGVKARIADFQSLSAETCQSHPFSAFPTIGEVIEERFRGQSGLLNAQEKPWVTALGEGLQWVVLEDADSTERVRGLADRLSRTRWQVAAGLESEPYIGGTPAGVPRPIEVLWRADILYVQRGSPAKMARLVPQEIARAFNRQDITDAIKLCYERAPGFINEYLEDNFNLAPPQEKDYIDDSANSEKGPDTEEADVLDEQAPDDGDTNNDRAEVDSPTADEDDSEDGPPTPRPARPARPPRPSIIERFARAQGFSVNGSEKFHHEDGSSLERTLGNVFPWELKSASGKTERYYWPREHCIQKEPLQLEAEIWELCQRFPDLYSLVLTTVNGVPTEVDGNQLVTMQEQHALVLYPAAYRLEYRGEQ